MTEITSQEIREKISNGETFLLDFYATWCGPCKILIPNLERAESDLLENNIKIYKYNVETDRDYTVQMGIRGVPTLKFFKEGKLVSTSSGVLGHQQIKDFVGV